MKDKIVIIGANDYQNRLIIKAKELGYETHVFAWEEGAAGKINADYFYPISIVDIDEIFEECKKINPVGVCSVGSDLAIITVSSLCERMGLPGNSLKSTMIATNKHEMRKALKTNNIRTPFFCKTEAGIMVDEFSDLKCPLIVKPTDRSGSRGITKIETIEDLEAAIQCAVSYSFEKAAIIEEYIEGVEYSCEMISQRGKHKLLAVTSKYTTGSPNYIETGHSQPVELSKEVLIDIESMLISALDALEIKNGASHPEIKIDDKGNICIIEVGPRMGGDCIGSDLVEISTGHDFVKMVIDIACGHSIDLSNPTAKSNALIKFILTKDDYDEMIRLKKTNPDWFHRISDIDTSRLNKNERIACSEDRLGYFILSIPGYEEFRSVEKSLFD